MQKQDLPLPHNYRPADGSQQPAPLIVMLHGYGSDENDLFSFAGQLPAKYAIVSLRAPLSMVPYGNAWYTIHFDTADGKFSDEKEAVQARELIKECLVQIIEKYQVDPGRVTLLGFSQGCILAYATALSYPGKVQKVIGLSGYVNPDILKEGFEKMDHSRLQVYASHGSADQVIPVDWARHTEPFFKKLGVPCSYSEFPVGHGVAPQNFQEFVTWLETH